MVGNWEVPRQASHFCELKLFENFLSWSRPDLVNPVATFQVRSDLVPNLALTSWPVFWFYICIVPLILAVSSIRKRLDRHHFKSLIIGAVEACPILFSNGRHCFFLWRPGYLDFCLALSEEKKKTEEILRPKTSVRTRPESRTNLLTGLQRSSGLRAMSRKANLLVLEWLRVRECGCFTSWQFVPVTFHNSFVS